MAGLAVCWMWIVSHVPSRVGSGSGGRLGQSQPAAQSSTGTLHYTVIHCTVFHCTAIHCNVQIYCSESLTFMVQYWTVHQNTAVPCTSILHCTPLLYGKVALHFIKQYCITVQYVLLCPFSNLPEWYGLVRNSGVKENNKKAKTYQEKLDNIKWKREIYLSSREAGTLSLQLVWSRPGGPYLHGTVTVVHCTVLHCMALHCTALHGTALYCTAWHCNILQCAALHCRNALQWTTLN